MRATTTFNRLVALRGASEDVPRVVELRDGGGVLGEEAALLGPQVDDEPDEEERWGCAH